MHYGNIDTDAQVNCATYALLLAFPTLAKYYHAQEAGVVGIGGSMCTVGFLQDVPVHVGDGLVDPRAVVRTMFYVLDVDNMYSLLLGHKFLNALHGLVDVTHHRL